MKYYDDRKYYHFYNDTYEVNLYIFFGDLDNFNKQTNLKVSQSSEMLGYCARDSGNGQTDIWLKNRRVPAATMAHEAFHASNGIFKHTGCKVDIDNDEPQAYLISWIVNCMVKARCHKPK